MSYETQVFQVPNLSYFDINCYLFNLEFQIHLNQFSTRLEHKYFRLSLLNIFAKLLAYYESELPNFQWEASPFIWGRLVYYQVSKLLQQDYTSPQLEGEYYGKEYLQAFLQLSVDVVAIRALVYKVNGFFMPPNVAELLIQLNRIFLFSIVLLVVKPAVIF